jgi:heptosyltransferase-2
MDKKLLVRAPNWVGDGIMAIPALSALRAHFKDAEITLLAKPTVASIFFHHPEINRIIIYEDPGKHAGFVGFLRLALHLRKERFDMAVLFKNAFESALLATLSGIPYRIGYNTDSRGLFLTHPLKIESAPLHQREAYLHIVRQMGVAVFARPPYIILTEVEIVAARRVLESSGICAGDFVVGISPGTAKGPAKAWLPGRFSAVADSLVETYRAKILLLGGPNDLSAGAAVLREMKSQPINFIGKLSLREMIAVISLCDLCITNDSGPVHIASALQIPQVAIYGPRPPSLSFPGGPLDAMVYHAVNCSPCDFRVCPVNHHCMTGITVEEVLEKVRKVLGKVSNAQAILKIKI